MSVSRSCINVAAWLPWCLLVVLVFCWGYAPVKSRLNAAPGAVVEWKVPAVHGVVYRNTPVVRAKEIGPEGKITVKDGIVTLPLRLEINKGNVESLKF